MAQLESLSSDGSNGGSNNWSSGGRIRLVLVRMPQQAGGADLGDARTAYRRLHVVQQAKLDVAAVAEAAGDGIARHPP